MEAPWVRYCSKLAINFQQQPPRLVRWGFHPSPFGPLMIGWSDEDEAVCRISFTSGHKASELLREWQEKWPQTQFVGDEKKTAKIASWFKGKYKSSFAVRMTGTPFQLAVWKQIAKIPAGEVASYGEIAARIKRPKAVRAVGTACGSNPVPFVVPCHRVIGANGTIGGFGGGLLLKCALLRLEGVSGLKDLEDWGAL